MNTLYPNPFRPGSGLFPPYFAGRDEQIKTFEKKLKSTVTNTPMHMAVIGGWGIGKSSLLTKFESIASENDCFVISTIASVEDTPTFVSNLLRRLKTDIETQKTKFKELVLSLGLLKLKFESAGEAQLSLEEALRKIWNKANKPILVTIDDLDLIKDFKGSMLLLRNTAMHLTKKNCKVMFVVAGTNALFDKMYEVHEPLIRFFEPTILDNLNEQESIKAVKIPLENVGMDYEKDVVEEIAAVSEGHPYYIQEISNHVFEGSEKKFDCEAFRKGFGKAFSDISRDIFSRKFESISPIEKKILSALTGSKPLPFSEILNKSKIKKGSLSPCLARLKEKGIIKQENKEYFIESKLFGQYIKERLS
ncbi:MAG: hypothetical protein COS08_07885 [Euryarchaeota archaeon CG01_land_8_20_14_3_00_38_12]|nr:MAG: hypothetical protein COS08_07885 [Euryarchaeota archaeon CG01_land_8_20_14_3_00_38_12]PJB21481.1 MAG: hypothetical protein CO114_05045 [Euryarchaeota archaeon CG_4_9_14_3_um_filter_38_12]